MVRRRVLGVSAVLALLIACDRAGESNDSTTGDVVQSPSTIRSADVNKVDEPEERAGEAAPVQVPSDDPGLADMSPWQRRAYEKGYQDCAAGRYDPDPYPEAYRIGCGAAHERQSGQDGAAAR